MGYPLNALTETINTINLGGGIYGSVGTVSTDWLIPEANRIGQKLSMQFVWPRPDNETNINSYHRKAHTQILYRVPICIQGGERPLKYELLNAPTGATIVSEMQRTVDGITGKTIHTRQENLGLIQWDCSEFSQLSEHTFSVRVTDQSQNFVTLNWVAVVDNNAFVVVDSNVATSGDGTFDNPLKTFADLWGTAATNTYQNKIAYFKAGTYQPVEDGANSCGLDPNKPIALIGESKETVTFDTTLGHFFVNRGNTAFYGIAFEGHRNDANNRIIQVSTKEDNILFYELSFDNVTVGTVGNDNASCIMFFDDSTYLFNAAIVNCYTLSNCDVQLVCTYTVDGVLVENCVLGSDLPVSNGAQGIHIKDDTKNCTVVFCTVIGNYPSGHIRISNQQTIGEGGSASQEVLYNTIIDTAEDWGFEGSALSWNQNSTGASNPENTFSARNTVITIKYAHTFRDWLASGNNVQTSGNAWSAFNYSEGNAYTEVIPNSVQLTDNDFDAEGKLTDTNSARTLYLGKIGREISN